MSKEKISLFTTSCDGDKSNDKGELCVFYKCEKDSLVKEVLGKRPGWTEVSNDYEWDFHWCNVTWLRKKFVHSQMKKNARINHFPNNYELTMKNLMARNLRKYQKMSSKDSSCLGVYDFFPETFQMPIDYHLFVEHFKRYPGSIWIMKPAASSQGKGIFLFKDLKDIMNWKKTRVTPKEGKEELKPPVYVAQRYIEDPYLINGRKFDLRIYVLVTSFTPLKAWLYRDGFARLSGPRFFLNSIHDKFVHLTNVAIQKKAPGYDGDKFGKWNLQQLRRYLTAKHHRTDVEMLFKMIDNIIISSLLSVQNIIINDKHCFELYGYDILLDQYLKPWLIEVNASPSMTPSSQDDHLLKYRLLEDTLNIIDMEGRLSGSEKRVGGFDLIWDDGLVFREDVDMDRLGMSTIIANSHLGCVNDRENHIYQLWKPFSYL
ncbi:putative tubulin polyglutamylase TTLL9 [Synchiropus picturatus]